MGIIDSALERLYFRHSGLDPESSHINIGTHCAPLDTGLRRYDALLYSCWINRGSAGRKDLMFRNVSHLGEETTGDRFLSAWQDEL
ncbi:hypothetical protein GALL_119790 [mine drainage metagenome]|uniref:Uncharacterized protein n=1 Tax=mine drainage metagenome TaxID=410659 RepID=A0A1J5SW76_9ZZZZ